MQNGNGRPVIGKKKAVRLMVALTILAWATQTLMSQWGFGADVRADASAPATAPSEDLVTIEKFVPGTSRFAAGATIELRSDATVVGEEVKLKQVARWTQADDAVLAPLGDLVLARIGGGTPFRAVSIAEVKETLTAAGINIASLKFVGATSCTVNRSDVEYDERTALQQWIEAKEASGAMAPAAREQEETAQALPASAPVEAEQKTVRTLRNLLIEDLAQRFTVPADSLQLTFKGSDERLLNLAEPLFRFDIEPVRGAKNLGEVSWLVLIRGDRPEDVQKATITARARAWHNQLVVAKPLAMRQLIRDEDLIERRALVERLPDEPIATRAEVVGQAAARPLSAGTVLTARAVEAQQLVKAGQYVTITLQQGAVSIKSVAKALEGGSYGQTIRVKNEATRDVFQVILTGPQTATMNLSAPPPGASPAAPSSTPSNLANAGN
jgi:flagella basal body P-ring formation protein FlgA